MQQTIANYVGKLTRALHLDAMQQVPELAEALSANAAVLSFSYGKCRPGRS